MRSVSLFAAGLLALVSSPAFAQTLADAETLPAKSGGLIIQPAFGYGPGALQRFGNGWRFGRESLVADFDGIDLTDVIAGDSGEGLRTVVGSLGITSFKAKQTAFAVNFFAAYGVTDRLMVAVLAPFMSVRYTLDASLELADNHSTFRVRNAEQLRCPGGDFALDDLDSLVGNENSLLVEGGPNYRFNIGDLNRALGSDCLGYRQPVDEFETRDGVVHGIGKRTFSGFRDTALAAKYKLFHGEHIRLGLIGYMIFPTGKVDDPSDLFDFKFGDGNWGGALLGAITVPFGPFSFGASFGYEYEAPDSIELRMNGLTFDPGLEDRLARGEITEEQLFRDHVDEGQLVPIVTRFDQVKVKRKLGDNIYIYTQFFYQVLEWMSIGLTVNFLHHFRDRITSIGPRPEGAGRYKTADQIRAEVDQLIADGEIDEDDKIDELKARLGESDGRKKAAYGWRTTRGNLVAGIGVNFNTLGLFARGEFPIPLIAGIGVSRFIAGQNIDTPEAINLQIVIPFVTSLDIKDPTEYGYDDEEGGGLPWP